MPATSDTTGKVRKSVRKFTDGSNTPEYECWKNMRRRCRDNKISNYKNYGGRGIKVCERWDKSFDNFIRDIGRRPSDQHSLERINVNKDYCPENCKWDTWANQCRNRTKRSDNSTGVTGVKYDSSGKRYIAYISIDSKQVTHSFSCKKFGERQAKAKAIEKRKQLLDLYNYSKNHGE